MTTDAASVRLVVFAETVNDDCSTPEESMLTVVGEADGLEMVGSPLGQPAAGQNVAVEDAIVEFALPSLLLRTSVNVTYCEPAPNTGVPAVTGNETDQLLPSPESSENWVGSAATLPSGCAVSVLSVTYTLSDAVSPFVLALNVIVESRVPSTSITTGLGALTETDTNCGGTSPITLAAFGLRSELSCATWCVPTWSFQETY